MPTSTAAVSVPVPVPVPVSGSISAPVATTVDRRAVANPTLAAPLPIGRPPPIAFCPPDRAEVPVFDVLTIAAVADEMAATLLDGRIQRIGLVDPRTLAAEVYAGGRRHFLVASADDRAARLGLVAAMPSLDAELVTPFGLLLRKYLRGGVLIGVDQPPLERLVRLSIAKRFPAGRTSDHPPPAADPDADPEPDEEGEGDATYVHLAVEIMGRHSNLILIDDAQRIMESAKRVTPAMSRVRPIHPRLPYTPPPPIDRPDPRRLTATATADLLATEPATSPLANLLVRRLRGLSPQMAREIAYRSTGDPAATLAALDHDAPAAIARETRALLEPLLTAAWSPRVYLSTPPPPESEDEANATPTPPPASPSPTPHAETAEGRTSSPSPAAAGEGAGGVRASAADPDAEDGTVASSPILAFAAVPHAHLAALHLEQPVPTISAAAELAFAPDDDADRSPLRHAQRRQRLLDAIAAARAKQERRLHAVREQSAKAADLDQLRQWGELIYAYLWQIAPGQTTLEVDGVAVSLDPALGPKENAQAYFERYRKAQSAGAHAPELEATIAAELAYLDQLRTLTEQAAAFAELESLAAEWETHAGVPPAPGRPRRRPDPKRPRPLLDAAGNAVYLGRSGAQNDQITFDLAGPNDTWLHARGVPGSHVVVRWHHPSGDEDPATIEAAAALAAFYSAARHSASVEVDVTRRRHVRKIKGTGPGMVTYRQERTIAVRPAAEASVAAVLLPSSGRT